MSANKAADTKTEAKPAAAELPAVMSVGWLAANDEKLKTDAKWNALKPKFEKFIADDATVEKTKAALVARGHKVSVVSSPADALALLVGDNLPKGAGVAFGGSVTLEAIGFIDAVKTRADLKNYRAEAMELMGKGDMAASMARRFEGGIKADYFYSSVSAIAETGEVISVDASGTRTAPLFGGAKNVVIVIGANKIVPTVADGLARAAEWSAPVASAQVRAAYKMPGTFLFNTAIVNGTWPAGRFHIIVVKGHSLGF